MTPALRRLVCLAVVSALVLGSASVRSATYYVATSGSDSAAGTATQPFQTIQRGVTAAQPGDTVVVQPGVFASGARVNSARSGSSSARITLRANGAVTNVNGFYFTHDYLTVDGFTFAGTNYPRFQGAVSLAASADYIHIINNSFHDLGTTNIPIMAISFGNAGDQPGDNSQSCLVSNNVMRTVYYHMISLMGANHLITDNILDTVASDFFRIQGGNITIRRNGCMNGGVIEGSSAAHTDLWQTVSQNLDTATNIVIEANVFENSPDCQICQMEGSNGDVPVAIRDWTIRNNVFNNISAVAQILVPDVKWYNNVFHLTGRNFAHPLAFQNTEASGRAHGGKVFNNVFIGCGPTPNDPTRGWYNFQGGLVNCEADYNYVANQNFTPKAQGTGSMYVWSEAHGINGGDPGFMALANANFRLVPTSRLIDKGRTIASFAADFDGITRPKGQTWDLGPFEFDSGRQPPAPPTDLRIVP